MSKSNDREPTREMDPSALRARVAELEQRVASLQESERMLRLVMETIPMRLFWKDRDYRFLGCNRVFAQDAGLRAPRELIGRDDFELSWRESAPIYRADDEAVIRDGKSKIDFEEPQQREDGTSLWLRTTKVPLRDEDGAIIGVFGCYYDITERVHAEQERRQLEDRLRHAQKIDSLGRLAGGIAHDFNNLLTVIVAQAERLRRQLAADGKAAGAVDDIATAAQRATTLTQQLLAFSRRQASESRVFDINAVVRGMQPLISRLLGEQIAIEVALEHEPAAMKGDPTHIEQILMNLAANARDAMPDGGTLRLETRLAADEVVLMVSDSGAGMSAEVAAQAFDPFFSTKDPGKGTGLGLSIVYGIVRQHGGSVELDSEPNRGTRLRLAFPRSHEPLGPREPTLGSLHAAQRSSTVLVVEDEDRVRRTMQIILEEAGHRVLVAASGEEALRVSRDWGDRIDAVVSDVVMPGMSGAALVPKLREQRPDIRAVLVSGYAAELVDPDALEPGIAFLPKPFTPSTLLAKLDELLHAA